MRLLRRPANPSDPIRVGLGGSIAIVLIVSLITAFGSGVSLWWFIGLPRLVTNEQLSPKDSFDLIKVALTVVGGIGGVVALVVAYRKQKLGESAERRLESAEYREDVRLFSEEFSRATEQIGSDKAPVRIAGMYVLERLADSNIDQQQTIANVLCAYLRMPSTASENNDDKSELEVRLTVQRILEKHLQPGEDLLNTPDTFWPDIELDLTGASLYDFSLTKCLIKECSFVNATFTGRSLFSKTTVEKFASFREARFKSDAWFAQVNFKDKSFFARSIFDGFAWFSNAEFYGDCSFVEAEIKKAVFSSAVFWAECKFKDSHFDKVAMFRDARFRGPLSFENCVFHQGAWLNLSNFESEANFTKIEASGGLDLMNAHFAGNVHFDDSTLEDHVLFADATFAGETSSFSGAILSNGASFHQSTFEGLANFKEAKLKSAMFLETTFTGGVDFQDCEFSKGVLFDRITIASNSPEGTIWIWPDDASQV
ncbi:pentapeptide repeat-containing protein [Saccharopolyspora sp. NPDC002578]